MKTNDTLPTGYFDNIYNNNDDPWGFQTSDYEKTKYKATIDALPRPIYENAFEIGCSIGVLTEMLAVRCHRLLSVDTTDIPITKARERLSSFPQVRFKKMEVPKEFPAEIFDLIIMSEVGYYFSMSDLEITQKLILEHLSSGGQLLMVHWTPTVDDYPLTGDQVHDFFLKFAGNGRPLKLLYGKREEKYRIELFEMI